MNKIINDLLNSNARVIIPDFGAFIIKQKSPRLIVFNEFLRYNDGLLIDYLSAKDNISKDVAKLKVTHFVEELNKKLEAGEEIVLEGMGKLIKESSGKLTLTEITGTESTTPKKEKKSTIEKEPKPVEEEHKTEKEKEIKATTNTEPKKETPKEEPKPASEQLEKKEESKPQQPKKDIKKEEIKPQEQPQEEKTEVEITLDKEEKAVAPDKKNQTSEKITITPIKTTDEKETVTKPQPEPKPAKKVEHQSRSKSNTLQIVIWILLIILVNGAIVSWFVFNDKITGIFKKDKQAATEVTTTTENTPEITSEESTTEPENPVIEPEEMSSPYSEEPAKKVKPPASVKPAIKEGKQFYIVAGCFKEENNADKLVNELKKDGYHSEKFGKIGNLHAVSFGSFSDKSAAITELKNIRTAGHPDAWIIYY